MKHNGKITISRPTYSDGSRLITISIEDDDAGIRFVDIEMPYENFAEAVTGLGFVDCKFEARNLDCVGKRIERRYIELKLPDGTSFRDKEGAVNEAQKQCPAGWIPKLYFGGQDSFFEREGVQYARTIIFRWVDKEGEE